MFVGRKVFSPGRLADGAGSRCMADRNEEHHAAEMRSKGMMNSGLAETTGLRIESAWRNSHGSRQEAQRRQAQTLAQFWRTKAMTTSRDPFPPVATRHRHATHRVAALLDRWWLGIHHGAIDATISTTSRRSFTFRFNRRRSQARGLLFFRLLQQAVQHEPVPYKGLARTFQSQQTEIAMQIDVLNRSIRAAKPNTIRIR